MLSRRRRVPEIDVPMDHHPIEYVPDSKLEELTGIDRHWIGARRRRLGIPAQRKGNHPWLTELVRAWPRAKVEAWLASLDERRSAVRALRQQAGALLRLVPVAEPVPVVEVPAAVPVAPEPKRVLKNMKPRIRTFADDETVTPAELAAAQAARPRTRGDCASGPRPCPWVGCRQHLFLDIAPTGSILVNHATSNPMELEDTCALDVADRGGSTLEEVGAAMGVTRERVRQIETNALWAWHQGAKRLGFEVYVDVFEGSGEDVYPDNGDDE